MCIRDRHKTKNLDEVLKLDKISITYSKQSILDQLLNRFSEKNITVKDIEIEINKGETIALVGESGSGKSTILKSIAGLLNTKNGAINFKKNITLSSDVRNRTNSQLRAIQLIFQNPDESLNPSHTVEEILSQPLKLYFQLTGDNLKENVVDLLKKVRLTENYYIDSQDNSQEARNKELL